MQPAVGPAKHMTGILMGAETQDSHGKPFVLVAPDVSVYDPAKSVNLLGYKQTKLLDSTRTSFVLD